MLQATRVVFPAPEVATLEAIAVAEDDLLPDELLLRTHVTLISPGTELARFQGRLGMHSDTPEIFPITRVGYAAVGTVLATGSDTGVQVGDRIYTMGAHASLARVNVRQQLAVPVPPALPDDLAVFTRLAVVSMTTLRTTLARAGDEVAIVGLGLVGNLAAQNCQAAGLTVHAFDLAPARRAVAVDCGLRSVHPAEAMPAFAQRCRLVIEATGTAPALAAAVELTSAGGEIVMIGAPWGGDANSVPSSRLTRAIFFRFLRLRSGSEWEIPRQPQPLALGSHHENSQTVLGWLADGRLQVAPLITHRLPPMRIQEAYLGLRDHKDEYLGVLLQWGAGT